MKWVILNVFRPPTSALLALVSLWFSFLVVFLLLFYFMLLCVNSLHVFVMYLLSLGRDSVFGFVWVCFDICCVALRCYCG